MISLKGSSLWKEFVIFELKKNMRAGEGEEQFAKEILEIGEGTVNDDDDQVKVPDECLFDGNLLSEIFADHIDDTNINSMLNRAVLATTNKEVDEINDAALKLIDGVEKTYYSIDQISEANTKKHRYVVELLNSLNPTGIPKHELKLKKNAIVMLLRNLDIESGLCNGTRMKVLEQMPNMLKCQIITGDKAGRIVFIPRIKLECTKGLPVPFYRKQFPIKLAFAMTINKSQGQTFDKVGLKLDENECFSHGQLYVGISRVRNWQSLKIVLKKKAKGKCTNIVYQEVL